MFVRALRPIAVSVLIFALSGPLWACADATGCISEILYDPPSAAPLDSNIPNQYIELRATPGLTFPNGTYLVTIEGDSAENPGTIEMVLDLSNRTVGSNGYMVVVMASHPFGPVINAQATTIAGDTTGFGDAATFHSGNNEIELGSWTTLLIQSATAPVLGADISPSSNNNPNGGGYPSWVKLDSIGMLGGGGGGDRVYAAFAFSKAGNGQNAVGTTARANLTEMQYVGRAGASTGDTAADWVAGDVLGGTPPNYTLSPATYPAAFANQPLDTIGGPSFPNVPNDPPVNTVPGAQTTPEDTALVFSVGNGNAISVADPDAGPAPATLFITLAVDSGHLTLASFTGLTFTSGDGTADASMQFRGSLADLNAALNGLSYQPEANFFGNVTLTITSNDQGFSGVGGALSDTDTVAITVTPEDDLPVAVDDGPFITDEDTALVGSVAGNDTGLGDTPISFALDTDAANGSALVNADGSFTYTPRADFNGVDSFTYTVTDVDGDTDTGTVSITVTPVDDLPVAGDDSFTTDEDTALSDSVAGNDTGLGDAPITFALGTGAANGSAVVNADGSFTYTPAADFNGADSFTYTVTDADGDAGTGTVSITVTPVDDLPVAGDDSFTTDEDTTLSDSVAGNDTGLGDTPITFALDTGAANGSAVVNGDGSFTYTPAADFNGADSFTYTVTDADGDAGTGTVSITVTPVDDLPVAVDDTFTTAEGVALSDTVATGDTGLGDTPITFALDTGAANGSAVVNADGSFTYTPDADFTGADGFTYTVTDADGDADTGAVSITVTPNDAPVANDDAGTVDEGGTLNGPSVKANDTDTEDGMPPGGLVSLVAGPANASSFTLNPDGTYVYLHDGSETTSDSFTYTVRDSVGAVSNVATVDLGITLLNDNAPVVGDQGFTLAENSANGTTVGTVLASDADVDAVLSYSFTPASSVFALDASTGEITVAEAAALDFETTPTFSLGVSVSDGVNSDTATITITLTDLDEIAPNVVSVARIGTSPTNAASVQFAVTFSENVTGVDASDFAVNATGVSGAAVSGVAGSGSAYTVTVDTGTGDGSLRLDVLADGSIVDAGSTALAAPFSGVEAFVIDKTAPTVVSSVRVDPNPPEFPAVLFRVTFSEAVTGVDLADFALATTIADAALIEVSGSGTTYDVLVYAGSAVGSLRLDVLDDDSIRDAATNPLAAGFSAGEAYDVDPAAFGDIFYDGFETTPN